MASTAEMKGKDLALNINEEDGEQDRQLKENEAVDIEKKEEEDGEQDRQLKENEAVDIEKKEEEEIIQFGCCGLFKNEASTSKNKEIQQEVSDVEEKDGRKQAEQAQRLSIIMEKKLAKVPREDQERPSPLTIFRLPARFHETNKQLCEPRMVSIGPYHRGKESLRAVEKHKWSLLHVFLEKCGPSGLETCLQTMSALEKRARQCYSEEVKMESDDFIEMLLLDGCFLLEFFRSERKYCADCDVGWANVIYSDVFLLENQIPYFVIHELLRESNTGFTPSECPVMNSSSNIYSLYVEGLKCKDTKHLLHLCYTKKIGKVWEQPKNLVDGNPATRRQQILHRAIAQGRTRGDDPSCNILCISELHEAGVRFQKKNSNEIFDISFENGIMKIPFLKIDHTDNIILWNMVAFEQTQQGKLKQILSSYLALMDSLINTEKDVAILERCGIVENYLQNQADAAHFFNQFGNHFGLDYTEHHFCSLYREIKAYSSLRRNRWRAKLVHDYFSNPWSGISFGAAAILLVLTILQTFLSQSDLQKLLRKLINK